MWDVDGAGLHLGLGERGDRLAEGGSGLDVVQASPFLGRQQLLIVGQLHEAVDDRSARPVDLHEAEQAPGRLLVG